MMRRRVGLALVAGLAAAVAISGPVSALLVWTLVGTPLTATAGNPMTFTLTGTNLDLVGELGCLEVVLPSGWEEVSAGSAVPSTGRNDWAAAASGTTVVAYSTSGGGRLETGDWVTITLTARPTIAGISTWANHAHQRKDCGGEDEVGLPIAVTVLPALPPTATPRPSATSVPTARPTLEATPKPTPAPTPRPTSTPRPSPQPTSNAPAPQPSESSRPTATSGQTGSPSPSVTEGGGTGAPSRPSDGDAGAPGGGTERAAASTAREVAVASYQTGELALGLGPLGVFGGVDTWIVPAATMGVPGLLILIWIGLQAAGAFAWVPAVRRLRDDEDEVPATAP